MSLRAPKRVLVVDDSRTIRAMLRAYIEADPRLLCLGEAGDPYEARAKIKALNPDVLTLDVEMPKMNGLVFLEHLMRLRPMPVVMVSTRTADNSSAAIQALSLGAVDCIDLVQFRHDPDGPTKLADMLFQAAAATIFPRTTPNIRQSSVPSARKFEWNGKFVLIGSSTGGVEAIERVLSAYPADCPPTLISQHMPANFLRSFAARLNDGVAPHVELLTDRVAAKPGSVFLAAGGACHGVVENHTQLHFAPRHDDGSSRYVPSINISFRSAERLARRCVAVLLTGMGRDGAEAMRALRDLGAWTIVQSGQSSVIDGMPKAARDLGAGCQIVDLAEIGDAILGASQKLTEESDV